ncbi:phage-related protein [Nocardiopsis mwathae]|uniref:Phage-related protein n=1 Tax=Nocardiopsis mwathae TaxID=1472723 RepID=A0A7X0D5X5_9ACTN|nr:type II toxin-antitoxin system RelE/ParE family toxin [Nocardiopsis mwathae]MBB6171544.1 phage-related protein [Nocardiopsis mwathae]
MTGRRWEFYSSPAGRDKIADDIKRARLSRSELARLELLLQRIAERSTYPRDVKALRDGVFEGRPDGDHRIFRVVYAEVACGVVLLALHFFEKRRQTEPKAIQLALDRLSDWRRRNHE